MTALSTVIAKRVGARVRELRRDAEMIQGELARRVYTHRPIVSRVERGLHMPCLEELARYAAALELDIATLLVCLDDTWIEAGREAARFLQSQNHQPAV